MDNRGGHRILNTLRELFEGHLACMEKQLVKNSEVQNDETGSEEGISIKEVQWIKNRHPTH